MEEEKKELSEQEEPKNAWQTQKESWYDKITLTLKQMDMIVYTCWGLLAVVIVLIALEALDIFHLFG